MAMRRTGKDGTKKNSTTSSSSTRQKPYEKVHVPMSRQEVGRLSKSLAGVTDKETAATLLSLLKSLDQSNASDSLADAMATVATADVAKADDNASSSEQQTATQPPTS